MHRNLNKVDFPVYVISLKESYQRQKTIKSKLDALGIPFKFIEASDDSNLSTKDVNAIGKDKLHKCPGRMVKGAVGCLISHMRVYNEILSSSAKYAMILEDDVQFLPNFKEILHKIIDYPFPWDLIHLGYSLCPFEKPFIIKKFYSLSLVHNHFIGTYLDHNNKSQDYRLGPIIMPTAESHAYLITAKGCQTALDKLPDIVMPIDLSFNMIDIHLRRAVSPPIALQKPGKGNVGGKMFNIQVANKSYYTPPATKVKSQASFKQRLKIFLRDKAKFGSIINFLKRVKITFNILFNSKSYNLTAKKRHDIQVS